MGWRAKLKCCKAVREEMEAKRSGGRISDIPSPGNVEHGE